ncbi:Alpha-2-macroglobulin [Bordetella sputigena]|uniref:alpha-2-macroglobulin family protein n=1 Tax=Bordetella sputigena TaxID=1416810 RepID=UPI0039EF336B
MEQRKRARLLAGVAILAVIIILAAAWLVHYSSSGNAPPADTSTRQGPSATAAGTGGSASAGAAGNSAGSSPGNTATIAAPAAATVGADPFAGLNCSARQYQGSLALSVTLTQPVDRKKDLGRYLQVIDSGAVQAAGRSDDDGAAKDTPAPSRAIEKGESSVSGKPVQGSWVVGDNPRVVYFPYIQPQRRYTVKLAADLPAADGSTLGQSAHCQLDTDAMPPAFYFASRGVVLPAGQNGGLPVATVNMPEVDVQFLRVAPEHVPAFFDILLGSRRNAGDSAEDADQDEGYNNSVSMKGAVSSWDLDRLNTIASSVYQGRFLTDDKPNRRHVTFLPVENIKELQESGIYVAVMSEPGRFRSEYQTTYFYVSDIGLHARRYADRIEAFSVSLRSGEPISGDTVELIDGAGKVLAKTNADAQGHVRFDGDYARASVLRATRGKEMTVLSLAEPALDLSEFDVGGLPSVDNSLFIYAGRDLYRPGETLQVSVLARDADGRLPKSAPLTATLKRPDGRVVQTALWRPDASVQGYIQHAIELPADAQTGTWLLEMRVDPGARNADATWAFHVEEFLPERMKLVLTAPDGVLPTGESLHVDVQGDYLYGAPAAGNRLLSNFTVRRDRYALSAQWPGFLFGDVADDKLRHYEELPESQLDDAGKGAIDVDLSGQKANSPLQVRVSASLLESGGRPVVRSITRSIWPAPVLIAVRPLFDGDVAAENTPAGFEAIRVNADGKIQPLAQAQMRLYREERQYYWRYDEQRGWNSGYTETEELADSRLLSLAGRETFNVPVGYGRYRLEISDPETGQTLRYRFYAGWGAQGDEAAGNRPDRVRMKMEGLPAKPGDTVKLTITPPHDGHALITVEGDRMLWSKWVDAKATGTEVDIPVDPAWKRHDLYVGAVVFRPGSQGDRVTPARAVGLAPLPLDTSARKLNVALQAPPKIRPETRQTVRVKVDGAANSQATVTLSAVDVGILNIDNYATPDPYGFFFGKHRYAPDLLDMYGKLIEKMDGTKGRLKWGGDAAMRGDTRNLPKKVKLVDLFSGPVKLDARGEAEIPLNIPDFNGTLRLMAVAFTGDSYGSADAEMIVAAPVVAELSTPRFITPGDRAAIALDVTNLTGRTQTFAVTLQALDPLAIADGQQRTVTLKNQQRTTLRYTATTTGSYGLGLMRVSVSSQDGADPIRIVRESVLQVEPAQAPERQVRRLRIMPGETARPDAAWIAGYYPDSVTVSLTVSDRPPFNVQRIVGNLLTYPYGCTEQTISAALPWLLMDADTARAYGVKDFAPAARQERVDRALQRLSGMRGSSGAYSLWGGPSGSRDVWLTAYAVGFLQDVRERGFSVPDATLDRSRSWLLQQVQQAPSGFGTWSAVLRTAVRSGRIPADAQSVLRDDHRRFAGLAAASLVLARDGKAPLATVRQLFDNYQERARSPLPLVQLAAAFKLMGDADRQRAALDAAMSRPYGVGTSFGGVDEWMGDYGSAVRDLALSYALMQQYDLRHARREVLLTDLAARLNGRSYFSTQEEMALLLAARASGVASAGSWEATLANGIDRTVLQGTDDRTVSLAAKDIGAMQLTNTGSRPVFAEFDVQGSAMQPPAPRANVIRLQRKWYRPDGRPWDGGTLQTGDMLVAWIRADAARAIPDGLITDRVPAGLEVENLNLSQNPDMNEWTIAQHRVADALSDPRIKHTEFRDDRYVAAVALGQGPVDIFYLLRVVTPGRYAVPSTVAEDMYRPEVRGVGESWGDIEIRDRGASGP